MFLYRTLCCPTGVLVISISNITITKLHRARIHHHHLLSPIEKLSSMPKLGNVSPWDLRFRGFHGSKGWLGVGVAVQETADGVLASNAPPDESKERVKRIKASDQHWENNKKVIARVLGTLKNRLYLTKFLVFVWHSNSIYFH
jgi:hypothetical protein